MNVSVSACKDALWQCESIKCGCFYLVLEPIIGTPNLYKLM